MAAAQAPRLRVRRRPWTAARITASLVKAVVIVLVLEGGARLVFAHKERVKGWLGVSPALNAYQVADPRHATMWRLRPNYVETVGAAIAAKKASGYVLGAKYLDERARALAIPDDDIRVRINSDGYRGPEIDKRHARVRILTIGDSTTFGTLERSTYPRSLQRELQARGRDVEVVNGGVEGYGPRQAVLRLDEFKSLDPEVATIFLGWNALFSEGEALGPGVPLGEPLYLFRVARLAFEKAEIAVRGHQRAAMRQYERAKYPDPAAPEIARLAGYRPPFLADVERLTREMKGAGARVVLLTLPGLYRSDQAPSAKALQIGHLPPYTSNPYVLARMSEEYNAWLRRLAVQEGVSLVDLEAWSRNALEPRDRFFFDSVHVYEEGQESIGRYLATEILPVLPAAPRRAARSIS